MFAICRTPWQSAAKTRSWKSLDQIKAGPEHGQAIIEVWNKTDLLGEDAARHLTERASASRTYIDMIDAFEVSCLTKGGVTELELGIEEALTRNDHILDVRVTPAHFSARAWLHQHGQVLRDEAGDDGTAEMQVRCRSPMPANSSPSIKSLS